MAKHRPIRNRWKRLHHGDDTGHMCDRCDEPLLVDRFGGGMRARCNACGSVEQLAELGIVEDHVLTSHYGVKAVVELMEPKKVEEHHDDKGNRRKEVGRE